MNDNTAPSPAPTSSGRYSLADDGQIFLQPDVSNPLPGDAVGRITKGDAILHPKCEGAPQDWLDIHVRGVLEPLFALKQEEGPGALTGSAKDIGARLFDHLGVMHRSDLEDLIGGLDPDMRKALRSKGVRLGPVLVFLPALVKPAAVRLRAMLWALWNDKSLPMERPADGRVSEVIDQAAVDRHFYRMIGYPVFGPRAIRIDMLDRVVTDVYDTADKGVFEAKHKYAEWLGCGLEDLHAVLESMGHRKLKTEMPSGAPIPETPAVAAAPIEAAPVTEAVAADGAALPVPETIAAIAPKTPPVIIKFMLKRGKMSERPHTHRKPHPKKEREDKPEAKKEERRFDPNKPQFKKDRDKGKDDRPRKPKYDRNKDKDREGRVYTFESKKSADDDDGNPFAVLKNLKK